MIFKYVAFHYLKNMLIILFGLSSLFAGLDFLMNASSLPSFNVKVLYFYLKIQEALNLLYPLAIIFGAIWTKVAFIKQNKVGALYALGITRKEFFKPFFVVGFFTYLIFVALNFTSFSTVQETSKSLFKNQYGVSKTKDLFFKYKTKYNTSFIYIGALIPEQYKLEDLTIFRMKRDRVVAIITAKEAWYNIYEWVATDAIKKSKFINKEGKQRLKIETLPIFHSLRDYQPKILESIYDGKALTLSETIFAKRLLEHQGLSTYQVRTEIYSKIIVPLFSLALLMILIFQFPFHARYMNVAITSAKAIGGTLFIWGILFALQTVAKNGTAMPELILILPIVLLWIYALITLRKSDNRI